MKVLLTFDDITGPDSTVYSALEIAEMITTTLKGHNILNSIFFTNTIYGIDNQQKEIWDKYSEAGEIANHGHSHANCHELTLEEAKSEIKVAQDKISSLGHRSRFFRYPYMNMLKSIEDREQLNLFMSELGLTDLPPTADSWDWFYTSIANKDLAKLNHVKKSELIGNFQNSVTDNIKLYQNINEELYGNKYPLIVLLHASSMNALGLDGIINKLKDMGAKFVSADDLTPLLEDSWKYTGEFEAHLTRIAKKQYPDHELLKQIELHNRLKDAKQRYHEVIPPCKWSTLLPIRCIKYLLKRLRSRKASKADLIAELY